MRNLHVVPMPVWYEQLLADSHPELVFIDMLRCVGAISQLHVSFSYLCLHSPARLESALPSSHNC